MKELILKSLEIMGYGMLAIFIVIGLLILFVVGMQRAETAVAKRKAEKEALALETAADEDTTADEE